MCVYDNTVQNAYAALTRRVLYKYIKSTKEYAQRAKPTAASIDRLLKFKRRMIRRTASPVKCGLWDFPKLYTGGKRKVYERAVLSLMTKPIEWVDAIVQAFIKFENTKLGADPRLIQSRSPRFHASLGCYLRPLEKSIYRTINQLFGEVTVTKGLNAMQVGKLIAGKFARYGNPVAVGLDASRFDRSVSKDMLLWVHDIYYGIYGNDRDLRELLEMQLYNRGIIYAKDGKIDYQVEGGIMSGDIDTSLKGCLIMCAMVWTWLDIVGIKASVVNNGDDCVVIMEKSDLGKFQDGLESHFGDLGFDIVAEEPVDEIEKVEFCQSRPVVCSTGDYILCRNPVVATVKDSMCRIPIERKVDAEAWMDAVASCGLALAGDMPIFSAYYNMYRRTAKVRSRSWVVQNGLFANGMLWQSKGLDIREGVTDDTRLSFWRAYGILPHEQVAIEQYYDSLTLEPQYMGPIENYPPSSFHTPPTYQVLANGPQQE